MEDLTATWSEPEVVLCGLSMVPIGFAGLVEAAAGAGFDAVTVGPAIYRRARRDGLSMSAMRAVLDDAGMKVTEVEGIANWLTPPEDKDPKWLPGVDDEELLELAEVLGAESVLVTHFGSPVPPERAAEAFSGLCDRAARSGLKVGLEFVAFATIRDLAGAWEVVRRAGRPNAGLVFDTWHWFRGEPQPEVLAAVPPSRILSVQLADADATVAGPLEDDILLRRLPGRGSLGLASVAGQLAGMGVKAPIGIEVWDKELLQRGPGPAAAALRRAVADFLSPGRRP